MVAGTASSSPTTEPPAESWIVVGRIVRPHGIGGRVLVESLSDNPERFAPGSELSARGGEGAVRLLRISSANRHGAGLLLTLEGVADRDAAAALAGTELLVARREVPPAPPGSFYQFELLGCRCRDREAGELGEVVEVLPGGGCQLLRIVGPQRELLVPFVAEFLVAIERQEKRIELALPPGLIEACTSPS